MIRQRMGTVMVGWLVSAVMLTIGAPAAGAATKSFSYTGGAEQQFTVPAGVSSVAITAIGGEGGSNGHVLLFLGGRGASITDVFAVTPGQTLYVEVAAAGKSDQFCCTASPGGGGKGGAGTGGDTEASNSGGGGGGASDVRKVPAATPGTLSSRLIVAAGGGGAGGGSLPGATEGGDAGMAAKGFGSAAGGGAGTLIAGGAGGNGFQAPAGAPGVLGAGGDGGGGRGVPYGGGGGGGGFYGGGGGGSSRGSGGQGGGGGSSFSAGGATTASLTSAPASITFTYVVGAATPPGTTPPGTTPPVTTPPVTTPPATGTAPSISALRLSRSAFRAARSGSSTSRRVIAGLPRVSYSLSAAARVRFGVERATIGRRVGGRCVRLSGSNRKRSRCTRFVRLSGTFTRDRPEGDDSFTLTGRLADRALSRGSYRLLATLITDAPSGLTKRVAFRIIRR